MKSAIEGGLKQSPDTVTSITQLDVGPADGAERWWHAELMMWCLLPDPQPPPHQTADWNSMNSRV